MDELGWDPYPAPRQIPEGAVDVWLLRLDLEDPAGALLATLSPAERQHAAQRRSALDGRRYAIGRASLRAILARYLGGPAAGLHFRNTWSIFAPEFEAPRLIQLAHLQIWSARPVT